MLEEAVREEIETVSGLTNNVFPLKAPEGYPPPYAAYLSSEGVNVKSLSGFLSSKSVEMELRVVCNTYEQLKAISSEVIQHLQSFEGRKIGTSNPLLVEEVFMEEPVEMWDSQLNIYRCIIELKLYL